MQSELQQGRRRIDSDNRSNSMNWLSMTLLFLAGAIIAAGVSLGLASCRANAQHGAGTEMSMEGVSAESSEPEVKTNTTMSKDKVVYSKSGYDVTPLTQARVEELAKKLKPEDAKIILNKGTEPAFCGNLLENHKDGVYVCKLCGLPLFASDAKFNSGTGWPSFFQPFDKDHVLQHEDGSYGMTRTEILCARCGAHLGHVFDDGPRPTGLRFCLNSASLEFVEKGSDGKLDLPPASRPVKTETAYFAGGCFWGVEDFFQQVPGVTDAISGYMGGRTQDPTYRDVSTHTTGHAETVKVIYDPARVTYKQLLEVFFRIHDPTQVDGQGPDIGDNYRSVIFAADGKQAEQAAAFTAEQQKAPRFKDRPIATQVVSPEKSGPFYQAEEYHQDYHRKHGGSCPLPSR
jgi:peptide methionine sulfoxide reductase msrA/msrB